MVKVTAWDPAQRIISLDIEGQLTQADVPADVITEEQWTAFLITVVQPVVDSLIQARIYDPNLLIQAGDMSQSLLTAEELDALARMGLGK